MTVWISGFFLKDMNGVGEKWLEMDVKRPFRPSRKFDAPPSIISFHNLLQNYFHFLFYNFTKIEIKSFECTKSKPATHCFTFNLSKLYLDHQTLGRWDERPRDLVCLIEDCRISKSDIILAKNQHTPRAMLCFINRCSAELPISAKIWLSQLIFKIQNNLNLSDFT